MPVKSLSQSYDANYLNHLLTIIVVICHAVCHSNVAVMADNRLPILSLVVNNEYIQQDKLIFSRIEYSRTSL